MLGFVEACFLLPLVHNQARPFLQHQNTCRQSRAARRRRTYGHVVSGDGFRRLAPGTREAILAHTIEDKIDAGVNAPLEDPSADHTDRLKSNWQQTAGFGPQVCGTS